MEIRFGFVTNSSSTNHIIMYNGKKEDLENILTAHFKNNGMYQFSKKLVDIGWKRDKKTKQFTDAIVTLPIKRAMATVLEAPSKRFLTGTEFAAEEIKNARSFDKDAARSLRLKHGKSKDDLNWFFQGMFAFHTHMACLSRELANLAKGFDIVAVIEVDDLDGGSKDREFMVNHRMAIFEDYLVWVTRGTHTED